jgi:hypothetical protein
MAQVYINIRIHRAANSPSLESEKRNTLLVETMWVSLLWYARLVLAMDVNSFPERLGNGIAFRTVSSRPGLE